MQISPCVDHKLKPKQINHLGPPAEILNRTDLESVLSKTNSSNDDSKDTEIFSEEIEGGQLVEEEEKDEGVVKLDVYKSYWLAVGSCLSPLVLFSLFLMQGNFQICHIVTIEV